VVSNDIGDAANIIRQGETGYVTAGNRPESLAEAVDNVLSRSGFESQTIRESVTGYAWANIAAGVADEMRKALEPAVIPAG
jgi:glycosyltransferase involved in cell wall biosynthesis